MVSRASTLVISLGVCQVARLGALWELNLVSFYIDK